MKLRSRFHGVSHHSRSGWRIEGGLWIGQHSEVMGGMMKSIQNGWLSAFILLSGSTFSCTLARSHSQLTASDEQVQS